jgi:sulfur-oxidizing protein SoxX
LAVDRAKGNCLACHHIDGGEAPGTIGPPLIAMSVRYADKDKLRAQIWDATVANPESAMPPFGSHQILSDEEIDQLVEFIWTK